MGQRVQQRIFRLSWVLLLTLGIPCMEMEFVVHHVSFRNVFPSTAALVAQDSAAIAPRMLHGPAAEAHWSDDTAERTESAAEDQEAEAKERNIRELIQLLGSDQYATRRRAQIELEYLGLEAFEALQEAFQDADPQIAASARYLINSAQIQWATEQDPPEVKEILQNYDLRSSSQRKSLMDRLAVLPRNEGWEALCRIAKYEPGNGLSKYAAMLLMNKRSDLAPDERIELANLILDKVGRSRRASSNWLKSYAEMLQDKSKETKAWVAIAENEHSLLDAGSEDTFGELVQTLYQWTALWSQEQDQRDDALRMARGAVRIVGDDPMALRNSAYWVIDHGFPELVEEMESENNKLFAKSAELTYCLAESFRVRKENEKAEDIAGTAFANRSAGMIPTRDPRDFRTYRGFGLQGRGLFDWSEREYRAALENTRMLDVVSLKSRYFLGEMLHDLGRDDDAGKLWEEVLAELEKTGESFRQQLQVNLDLAGFFDPSAIISQAYLYQGISLAAKGDLIQARVKYNKAFEADGDNADVLIAMYRLDGDEAWRKLVLQRIRIVGEYFQTQINQKEQEFDSAGALGIATARKDLATMNNQFAWLISNTEGDLQLALRCSQRSLELEPQAPGYFDTLGRCHYALGELEEAVTTQRKAVEMEPFAMAMQRQLKLFEAALEQKKTGAAEAKP